MANKETEQFSDEIFERIFKEEVDDSFGDFENPVDGSINNFGKSIYFMYENIKRVTVKVQKNFTGQNKQVK